MMRFLPLAVFGVLSVFLALALLTSGAPTPPAALVGQPAPVTAIDGIDQGQFAQGVVVVNFFASWCAPCADEQPVLARLAARTDLRVVGIAYKDTPAALTAWLDRHGNPFAVVGDDPKGIAALDWGVYGVPETYVLVNGIVRHRHVGVLTDAAVARDILPLITGAGEP